MDLPLEAIAAAASRKMKRSVAVAEIQGDTPPCDPPEATAYTALAASQAMSNRRVQGCFNCSHNASFPLDIHSPRRDARRESNRGAARSASAQLGPAFHVANSCNTQATGIKFTGSG